MKSIQYHITHLTNEQIACIIAFMFLVTAVYLAITSPKKDDDDDSDDDGYLPHWPIKKGFKTNQ